MTRTQPAGTQEPRNIAAPTYGTPFLSFQRSANHRATEETAIKQSHSHFSTYRKGTQGSSCSRNSRGEGSKHSPILTLFSTALRSRSSLQPARCHPDLLQSPPSSTSSCTHTDVTCCFCSSFEPLQQLGSGCCCSGYPSALTMHQTPISPPTGTRAPFRSNDGF